MYTYVRTCLLKHMCVMPTLCMYLSAVDRLEILEYVKLILSTIATALRGNPANAKHFQENVSCIFLIPIIIYLLYAYSLLMNSYNLHII